MSKDSLSYGIILVAFLAIFVVLVYIPSNFSFTAAIVAIAIFVAAYSDEIAVKMKKGMK